MAMWQGVSQGLAAAEQTKLNRAELDLKKKVNERAEEAFNMDKLTTRAALATQLKSLYGPGSSSVSGTGGKSTKTSKIPEGVNKNNFQILVQKFSVDPKEVEKLYAAGGASGVAEAAKLAMTYSDKFKTGNYVGDSPDIVIGQMLEGALYTSSETKEYDWDKISKDIGLPLDEELRVMMGDTFVVPGAVSFDTPVLVEKPSLTDLADLEKRAVSNSEAMSRSELQKIKARMNQIVDDDLAGLTDDEKTLMKQEKAWLGDRLGQIESAQTSYKEEVYAPLIGLYGNSMRELVDYYGEFKGAPTNPAFFNASQQEISVPNEAVFRSLGRLGIFILGMRIRNLETGALIELTE